MRQQHEAAAGDGGRRRRQEAAAGGGGSSRVGRVAEDVQAGSGVQNAVDVCEV